MKTADGFEVEVEELHVVKHVPGFICGPAHMRNTKALAEYTRDIPSYSLDEGPYKMNVVHNVPNIDLNKEHLPKYRVTMYLNCHDKVVGAQPLDGSFSHLNYVGYVDELLNVTKEFIENVVANITWKEYATNWDY